MPPVTFFLSFFQQPGSPDWRMPYPMHFMKGHAVHVACMQSDRAAHKLQSHSSKCLRLRSFWTCRSVTRISCVFEPFQRLMQGSLNAKHSLPCWTVHMLVVQQQQQLVNLTALQPKIGAHSRCCPGAQSADLNGRIMIILHPFCAVRQ